jgi:hypothetical protein
VSLRSSTNLEKLLSAVILGAGLILVGASFTVACSSSPSGVDTKDAGTTAKSDAAARDAGTSADVVLDVGPCEPGSVKEFKPTPITPVVSPACSDTNDIAPFVGYCYSDAGEPGCVAWKILAANIACVADCLNTVYGAGTAAPGDAIPKAGPHWGPTFAVNNPGESDWLNVGGCVAVADPSKEGQACATALTNAFECEYYACVAVPGCSVPDYPASAQPRLKALQSCFSAADKGACASYASAATNACASIADGGDAPDAGPDAGDAGSAAFCFRAATDTAALTTMLTQQCGGGDGGGYKN